MARWSCGYQYDCNTVLGRNFQSIRSRKCLLPSSHGNITTHDHALVANSSLLLYTGHGLPWWFNNSFTQYGLDSAVSKLQFPQECLEFPPLCNTRLQVPALMREYLRFPGEYSHTRAASLNSQATTLNPRQMNCSSSFTGPLKPWNIF